MTTNSVSEQILKGRTYFYITDKRNVRTIFYSVGNINVDRFTLSPYFPLTQSTVHLFSVSKTEQT